MKKLIKRAMKRSMDFVETCSDDDNPQVRELVLIHKGKIEAFAAVLDAMDGDKVYLNIMGG